jgi:hypothetical protein
MIENNKLLFGLGFLVLSIFFFKGVVLKKQTNGIWQCFLKA